MLDGVYVTFSSSAIDTGLLSTCVVVSVLVVSLEPSVGKSLLVGVVLVGVSLIVAGTLVVFDVSGVVELIEEGEGEEA